MRETTLVLMLRRYKVTVGTGVFSILYMFMYSFINVDLFELLITALAKIETFKAEEVFLGLLFISTGILIDKIRFLRMSILKRKIDMEKLSTLRSTMTTVHDVVNNFLNNLLIFRLEAEKSAALTDDSLQLLDDLTQDTAHKLREIADLEEVFERDFGSGITGIVTPSTQAVSEAAEKG